jgi:ABC-2 type transport system ATP-binding protein
MPLLAVEQLKKSYKERLALAGVSLSVEAGEALALLGPNGAGKTTLFAILASLRDADSGTISFEGRVVDADDPGLRNGLGVVFQSPSLDPILTARENLILGAGLYGLGKLEAGGRADELLAWVGLSDRAGDRVATFSGGMKRRLEIARALLHRPKVLLLDEPTSGLDEAGFRQVWERLDQLRRDDGLALIVVTHRGDEAERCDRLIILDEGKVIAEGTPDELRARVPGELIELHGDGLGALAALVGDTAGREPEVTSFGLRLRVDGAHTLVARLIEALPDGVVQAVHLRQPTLGDVFVALTGKDLEA